MLQDAVDMFTAAYAPRGCLLVLSTINYTAENKGVQQHLSSLREQTLTSIEDRLRRGQREGDVSNTAVIPAIAGFYTTVLHGLSIQARDGASRHALTQIVDCSMAAWNQLTDDKLR